LLAANLPLNEPGQPGKVVMVTSPSPGDGKTSVTLGVARAYAQLGLRVVMIEADLRRPSFGRFTDVTSSAGIAGVLAGAAVGREVIWMDALTLKPVSLDDGDRGAVGVLPAGVLPDNPQRALADPAMALLIEEARAIADMVLIDTAPVGTVNDATTLRHSAEGVVIVARLNQTSKDAARRANRTLRNLGIEVLGLVITDANSGERHSRYYSALKKETAESPPERVRSSIPGGPV